MTVTVLIDATPLVLILSWKWSSVHAHLSGEDDGLTTLKPAQDRIDNFAHYLDAFTDDAIFDRLRKSETTGRPIGSTAFLTNLEALSGRVLKAGAPGRKRKKKNE